MTDRKEFQKKIEKQEGLQNYSEKELRYIKENPIAQGIYKNKYDKNNTIECRICKKTFNRKNKSHHMKTQKHIMNQNFHDLLTSFIIPKNK